MIFNIGIHNAQKKDKFLAYISDDIQVLCDIILIMNGKLCIYLSFIRGGFYEQ